MTLGPYCCPPGSTLTLSITNPNGSGQQAWRTTGRPHDIGLTTGLRKRVKVTPTWAFRKPKLPASRSHQRGLSEGPNYWRKLWKRVKVTSPWTSGGPNHRLLSFENGSRSHQRDFQQAKTTGISFECGSRSHQRWLSESQNKSATISAKIETICPSTFSEITWFNVRS